MGCLNEPNQENSKTSTPPCAVKFVPDHEIDGPVPLASQTSTQFIGNTSEIQSLHDGHFFQGHAIF